jgi:zinc protease
LVYKKRLAHEIDADYSAVSVDPTGFSISAQLLPGKDAAQLEREIDRELERIKNDLVSDKELQKAKNQVEAAFIFAQDSIFGQAMKIGYYEIAGGWRQMEGYLDGIRKVNREDIRRVAKKYLEHDRRTVGVLIPTKEKNP